MEMIDGMKLFSMYCNFGKAKGFRPSTLSKSEEELAKYVRQYLRADDAEQLCAEFRIDVPKGKTCTEYGSRFIAEHLYNHETFENARASRADRVKVLREFSEGSCCTVSVSASEPNTPSKGLRLAMPPTNSAVTSKLAVTRKPAVTSKPADTKISEDLSQLSTSELHALISQLQAISQK